MADATDYLTLINDRMWALLEANAEFDAAVKVGNRINVNTDTADPFKSNLQDGDLPQCEIVPASVEFLGYTHRRLFGQNSAHAPASSNWPDVQKFAFTIRLTHRNMRLVPIIQLAHNVMATLRNGGPTLGLTYVNTWGPVTGGAISYLDVAGTRRSVLSMNVPFTISNQGRSLLT